ncbi:MAG TPA: glycosyl hydrolase [Chitinophagales bacterium]|nr:glycosyl hydrolase [Chitinophagales bacterium]
MKFLLCIIFLSVVSVAWLSSCNQNSKSIADPVSYYPTSKPFVRWWWFATEIKKKDIKHQLNWVKEMNFGGVEICWLYPLYRYQKMYAEKYNRHYPIDTSAQKWLSPEWSEMVAYTKSYADSIGLSCDFTFGSAWIIAATYMDKAHSTQIYGDTAFRQALTYSWAYPDTQWVINHLDSKAFRIYSEPMVHALSGALKGSKSALFTDSWEIKLNATNKIWTQGFEKTFQEKFGYDIIPYMETGIDSFPDVRYDYMLHLDDYVTSGYYKPFVEKCRELGTWSKVQCLGAPADVMTLYSLVDIPETEAMLNNPRYGRIVSSSACLASKNLVSSETFTCMYGFPATYLRQEQTADLKMVADALFAQGINHHVYHGMPYNPQGSDSIDFFATTYFGPNGSLTPELPSFNSYIEKASAFLQQGITYTDVAVYLPYEDGVMKGPYPPERQRVWVWGEYELRYVYPPEETEGYHPIWINRHFLEEAKYINDKLVVGDAQFSSLYCDVAYIDIRALKKVLEFAKEGLPVCMKRLPKQPGFLKSADYAKMLEELSSLKNVSPKFEQVVQHPPLIQGDSLPEYWCRVEQDGTYYLFLSQPLSKDLQYPVYSGQSLMKQSEFRDLELYVNGKTIRQKFEFKPYQSLMLKITPNGEIETIDITFIPKDPVVLPHEQQKTYF